MFSEFITDTLLGIGSDAAGFYDMIADLVNNQVVTNQGAGQRKIEGSGGRPLSLLATLQDPA